MYDAARVVGGAPAGREVFGFSGEVGVVHTGRDLFGNAASCFRCRLPCVLEVTCFVLCFKGDVAVCMIPAAFCPADCACGGVLLCA